MNARTLVRLIALVPVLPVLPFSLLRGQDTLAPIVVTATRIPIPASSLGNSITVLDGAALRRAGITTVVEALRGVPSVAFAQAGGFGAQTSLFLRGGESDYVRVLVDGIPLNQAGGAIDLANLTTDNVARIEIARGPGSVLYGSDAMTGVIQIITRGGEGPARLMAEARGGSYGTMSGRLEAGAGGRTAALSVGAQHEATDGVLPFNNHDDNNSGSLRFTVTPDAATELRLSARYRTGTFHYPTNGSGALADSNQFAHSDQAVLGVDAGRRLGARVELRTLLGVTLGRDSSDDRQDNAADTNGIYASQSWRQTRRVGADLRANVRVAAPLMLTVGGALESERVRNRGGYQSSFGPGATPDTSYARANQAVYAQALVARGAVSVQAGARLDHNERFGDFGTWRAGVSIRMTGTTRLRASAGTGFKEPTFDENYDTPFSFGNPALRPERSTSIEGGIEQSLAGGRLQLAATGFSQRFTDLIQYTFATPSLTSPNYYNVASAVASGVELEARITASHALDWWAQYTFLHTSASDSGYDGSVFAQGQRLVRRPTHLGSLSGEWHGSRGSIGARVLYVGDRTDLDFNNFPASRVRLGAYTRLDAWAQWTILRPREGSTLRLTVRVDNVANARYQEVYGFGAPGRRVLLGARLDTR